MPTDILSYATAEAQNNYSVAVIKGTASSSSLAALPKRLGLLGDGSGSGLTVSVAAGSGPLVAALINEAGTVPTGVMVTVTQPDGTVLDTATPANSTGNVVLMNNGSLTGMVIPSPQAGLWTISVQLDPGAGEFQFLFSTVPTANVEQTVVSTLPEILGSASIGLALNAHAEGVNDCIWCQLGFYALAVLIGAALVLGSALLLPGSAVVTSVSVALSLTAGAALAFIVELAGNGTSAIVQAICRHIGACSSDPQPALSLA